MLFLTNVNLSEGLGLIRYLAFEQSGLNSITLPNSLTNIDGEAFYGTPLTSITIPPNVTAFVGGSVFAGCQSLQAVYFKGNPPTVPNNSQDFRFAPATAYYLPGATGWGSNFDGIPAVLWNPRAIGSGIATGQYGFNITGPAGVTVLVVATTNLVNPVWSTVSTNTLTNGVSTFQDPQWTNYPQHFYRFRSP